MTSPLHCKEPNCDAPNLQAGEQPLANSPSRRKKLQPNRFWIVLDCGLDCKRGPGPPPLLPRSAFNPRLLPVINLPRFQVLLALSGLAVASAGSLAADPPAPAATPPVPFSRTEAGAANRAKLAADLAAAPAPQPVELPPTPAGPFQETWDSLRVNYRAPAWFVDAKFGLCMHWGLFSVPARQSEWYVRYMYGGNPGIERQHIAKWGPLDQFGYKDFIPLFTAQKWDPAAWAALFKESGARFFSPTGEHHDGFSLWDSALQQIQFRELRAPSGHPRRTRRGRPQGGPQIRGQQPQLRTFQLHSGRPQQRPERSRLARLLPRLRPERGGPRGLQCALGQEEPGVDRQVPAGPALVRQRRQRPRMGSRSSSRSPRITTIAPRSGARRFP